ncbi:MAG TPA: alpha/beta fold hydrolase [Solirubrobacteraceae bacterium]|nr:alpha/beta fold hydrolase [Solirubrobacteraceae bacterium]
MAAAGAAWAWQGLADRRAIAADPVHDALEREPGGRERPVHALDGTRLHVREFGPPEGSPLVLVHGWTCALRFWTLQIQALASERRVIAYDLRGHGASASAGTDGYSIEAHAGDLDAVLSAVLAPDERAVVAGHSLGAMTLVAWAGAHAGAVGERLRAAALINTGVGDLISESFVVRAPTALAAARDAVGRVLLSARAPLPPASPISHRAVRYIALSPTASPAQVDFCERMVLACPRDSRAGCGGTLTRLDLREAVASLDVPTTVIAGERDRLTPPAHARGLAAALPNLERELVLAGAGHMTPVTDPELVTAELRRLG